LDLDGSLTGKGANSMSTFFYPHLEVEECERSEVFDGVNCDPTVQIRRIAIHNYLPSQLFDGIGMKILRYDDDYIKA
jgi:hypothetical protein